MLMKTNPGFWFFFSKHHLVLYFQICSPTAAGEVPTTTELFTYFLPAAAVTCSVPHVWPGWLSISHDLTGEKYFSLCY